MTSISSEEPGAICTRARGSEPGMAVSEKFPYLNVVRRSRGNVHRNHVVNGGRRLRRFHQKWVAVLLVAGGLEAQVSIASGDQSGKLRTESMTALSRLNKGGCGAFEALEVASGVWATRLEPFFVFMVDGRDEFQQRRRRDRD